MNYSKKYQMVRRYYNTWFNGERLWSLSKTANAVTKGWITAAEFEEITGEAFETLHPQT